MNKQKNFPSIHFESSLYFGEISNISDLKKLFQLYEGTLTKSEILKLRNRVVEGIGECPHIFGTKSGDCGSTTFGEFLEKNNIII